MESSVNHLLEARLLRRAVHVFPLAHWQATRGIAKDRLFVDRGNLLFTVRDRIRQLSWLNIATAISSPAGLTSYRVVREWGRN